MIPCAQTVCDVVAMSRDQQVFVDGASKVTAVILKEGDHVSGICGCLPGNLNATLPALTIQKNDASWSQRKHERNWGSRQTRSQTNKKTSGLKS